jgi:hypothetical protein
MITSGIREFMCRDWAAARRAKDAYWGERIARLGPAEGFRIAEELRRQARAGDGHWPSADDRRQDLLGHARLAELLLRARPARRR